MNYKIIIEKKEPNPDFEAELAKWQEASKYSRFEPSSDYPSATKVSNALMCELTEEQFKAIKAEVFKAFE